MGLVLYGGYYDKKEALEILNNMKYYNRNLEQIGSYKELQEGIGIIPYMRIYENKIHEDFLVDKLKVIKTILIKQGNDAIDAYERLTTPAQDHFLQPLKQFFEDDDFLKEILDELSIPMKKDEFEHYLDIYNQFYKKDKSTTA